MRPSPTPTLLIPSHRLTLPHPRQNRQMAKSAHVVEGWDFDRCIPCHGDTIETGAKQAWKDVYEWYFKDVKAGQLGSTGGV